MFNIIPYSGFKKNTIFFRKCFPLARDPAVA